MPENSKGGPCAGGRPDAFDLAVQATLAQAAVQQWVVEERAKLGNARAYKRAWARALGLREPERMSHGELVRLAAWDRMLNEHDRVA
jgi:hypothetical protein